MVTKNDKNTEKLSCSTVVYDSNNLYIKIQILFYLLIYYDQILHYMERKKIPVQSPLNIPKRGNRYEQ
jgi:hypothetical protein